jgi:phosphatidate cytidylyltransferase
VSPAERLFDPSGAFDHPVTVGVTAVAGGLVALSLVAVEVLARAGKLSPKLHQELRDRCRTWAVLLPAILGPVLLGAAFVFAAVLVLALASYREYARATGLFRERAVSVLVVVGILALTFALVDHWYGFFVALGALGTCVIAASGLIGDRPEGYLQRVALGLFAFLFFGVCFGHLAYFGNDAAFRPILAWLGLSVALNDVFAYVVGKTMGRRKLAPRTSPNKTVEGALGALVLTTALAAGLGHFVFEGTDVDRPVHLVAMGVLISVGGQLGDLMLSSIKRDVGIKDMGSLLPGHGGVLDRFTSFLIVAPAVFHYLGYFLGVGLDEPARILTGG